MRNLVLFLFVSSVFFSPTHSQNVLTSHTRVAGAKFSDSTITINGILSEWNFQDSIFFQDWHKRGEDDNSAFVKIRWDKQKLYLAYRIYDTKLNARHTENNREVFTDDCVELYISTNYKQALEDKLTQHEHQFVVNINNALSTIRGKYQPEKGDTGKDFKWRTDMFAVVKTHGTINDNSDMDSGYVVEMAVNWSSIGYVPKAKDTLLFDLCVEDRDDSINYYAFDISFLPQYFSQPKRWWKLILEEEKTHPVSDAKSKGRAIQKKTENRTKYILFTSAAVLVLFVSYFLFRRIKNGENQFLPGESGKILPSLHYEDLVKKVALIIEEEYKKDLKTGDVAGRLHISERHLQRILKESTGKRFRQYLNEVRIKKSIELMQDERLSLNEIAFEAGYQSYSHYIKIFKLYNLGVSPITFREQNRQKGLPKTT
jgi:AraC-like DNA-binding protein